MEISSFSFLTPEDCYPFHSLYPDLSALDNAASLPSKRRRRDGNGADGDDGLKKPAPTDTLKEVLASILLIEEEENQDNFAWAFSAQQEKDLIGSNFRQASDCVMNYHENLESQYSEEAVEAEISRKKRGRASSAVAAAAAAVDSDPAAAEASASTAKVPHRRLWVKDRSKDWWDRCSHPDFPESEFKRAFRMSRATFNLICDELDPVINKKDTMLRLAIPVKQRVAVCIWRLATGEPLRLVSRRFGLGISTCHKLVLEVCSAIKNTLMSKYLNWPDDSRVSQIKSEFESASGIPKVAGSMYTTHIPIIAPKISVAAYFNKRQTERNQKTSYSITVQGVVDPRGVFSDVCIGWPGSMLDEQVLEKSALFQRGARGLLRDVWIVGSSGYPLMDWVLVPYTHQNLTWTQHAFNEKIGEVQNVAKDAFGRLKGRWGCLQKRTEVKLQDLPAVLGACCVLHNICEMRGEELEPDLRFDVFDDEVVPENPMRSASAVQARDHIAHNLLHHGLAGTSFH